jgi:RecB family exonuclease
VIAPRTTRLIRVPGAAAFRRAILGLGATGTVAEIRRRAVIVPSRAAAEQLRRSLEDEILGDAPGALAIPHLLTRDDWMAMLQDGLAADAPPASALEREVLLRAAARAAIDEGIRPPFTLRPGLVAGMLAFYDEIRRHRRGVDDFERLAVNRLEEAVESDRGAVRMLDQTRFLVAAFRGYETRLAESGLADEHVLRRALIDAPGTCFSHVVVAVGDRAGDASGLWPADFDLLTRVAGLSRIDIVATGAVLATGLLTRLRQWLPGLEELDDAAGAALEAPRLLAPGGEGGPLFWRARDREEELADVARAIKRAHRLGPATPLSRTAVVFKRPLPYVYLARQLFAAAGLPYQAFDALPLAAEPFASMLDVIVETAATGFTRAALVSLLRSPLLSFTIDGRQVDGAAVALLDRALSDARYLAEPSELERFASAWTAPGDLHRAARAAREIGDALAPLGRTGRPAEHLELLIGFLAAHERLPHAGHPARERHLRVQSAILSALARLRDVHRRLDDTERPFEETAALIRRWIEQQTFAPRDGSVGVQLIDADAARFGAFDTLHLVGLTQREWPESDARGIFYPASMLADLGWPQEADARAAERARFDDLLRSAARLVRVSTITLEDDAIVEPSPYLDDLAQSGLAAERASRAAVPRIFGGEAVLGDPIRPDALAETAAAWLALRASRTPATDARFHGQADPAENSTYRVSALDQYLACPFVYFAERVLGLEEDPEDEEALDPRLQGTLVHAVLESFFRAWQERGHAAITPECLADARALFGEVAEAHLAKLSPTEAALQRTRLLGSPVAEGVGDIAFAAEAARDGGAVIVERLLEHKLDGAVALGAGEAARTVKLAAKADRIDLFDDGTFQVIDYKLTRAPDLKHVVQLPAYAAAARQTLDGRRGRSWRASGAAYITFGKGEHVVPLVAKADKLDAALAEGEARLLGAVGRIEQGAFPPSPADPRKCRTCPFAGVCRKDYVDVE